MLPTVPHYHGRTHFKQIIAWLGMAFTQHDVKCYLKTWHSFAKRGWAQRRWHHDPVAPTFLFVCLWGEGHRSLWKARCALRTKSDQTPWLLHFWGNCRVEQIFSGLFPKYDHLCNRYCLNLKGKKGERREDEVYRIVYGRQFTKYMSPPNLMESPK